MKSIRFLEKVSIFFIFIAKNIETDYNCCSKTGFMIYKIINYELIKYQS